MTISLTFKQYVLIGLVNTALHWLTASMLYVFAHWGQGSSNLLGFAVAVTFSFFANASWNFKERPTLLRYVLFTLFMAGMAFGQGALAQYYALPLLVSLVTFSFTSLVLGYLFSRYVVFRKN